MDNNLLNSIAFPGDTYRSLLLDIGKFKSHDLDNEQIMRQKAIAFIISFINGVNKLNSNSSNEVNKIIFGENFNLIQPKYLAELAFNKDTIDIILELLKEFDNSYFWEAFGVSEEKGVAFYNKLQHPDKFQNVLCEIHKEIVDSNKIKKEIVINEILQFCLFGVDIPEDFCDELAGISLCFNEILQKYPSVREALSILYNDGTNFNVISFLKGIELFGKSGLI